MGEEENPTKNENQKENKKETEKIENKPQKSSSKLRIFIPFVLSLFMLIPAYYFLDKKPNAFKDFINKYTNPKIKVLSSDPRIVFYEDFLTDYEVDHLIKLGSGRMQRSQGVAETGYETGDYRTSSSAYLQEEEDEIVSSIEKRICSLLFDCTVKKMEALQVLNYKKGQKFDAHFDWFSETLVKKYGQRSHTFLIYLNDLKEEDGGGTYFPKLDLRVTPKKRGMVYFQNVKYGETQGDENTLHSGEPLLTDVEKWAVNSWIRGEDYRGVYPGQELLTPAPSDQNEQTDQTEEVESNEEETNETNEVSEVNEESDEEVHIEYKEGESEPQSQQS